MPLAKHHAARIKTPGAFLNNATRRPGYGRTSGMKWVIARAELAMDGIFCVFEEGTGSLSLLAGLKAMRA
ncbi:hypothetical protein ACJ2_22130 [Pantoea sp. QMID2]|nr:hypothetical protein ACJ3_11110 [Pantoea sp. QMID3]GME33343.1 hypothetical protein ACJ1_11030 [Pantoea sp. QMID1]GME56206.1 hypothetical protein ACJ4_22110 [Pantoea sp. QMID4]GME57335.1 hypothetical protein ACJ2_22130 [Pantoea sp. QMID2]